MTDLFTPDELARIGSDANSRAYTLASREQYREASATWLIYAKVRHHLVAIGKWESPIHWVPPWASHEYHQWLARQARERTREARA